MSHKLRVVTHGVETHVYIDDKEIRCVSANIDYQPFELPVLRFELQSTDIEIESDNVEIEPNLSLLEKKTRTLLINETARRYGKFASEVTMDDLKHFYDDFTNHRIHTIYTIGPKRLKMLKMLLEKSGYQFNETMEENKDD